MILRVFNKDLPLRNLIFVFGEGVLIYAVVLVSTFLRLDKASFLLLSYQVLAEALLIMVVFLSSFYLNDLYNLKVADSYKEIGLRLTKAIGIGYIILALIYYGVPSLLAGNGIFLISVFFIILGISWRFGYNYLLKKKAEQRIRSLQSGDGLTKET